MFADQAIATGCRGDEACFWGNFSLSERISDQQFDIHSTCGSSIRRRTEGGRHAFSPRRIHQETPLWCRMREQETSLVEALAYCMGHVPIPGSVPNGTTVSDFEPEEIRHRTSFNTGVLHARSNPTLNLLDAPGASASWPKPEARSARPTA
ncbi:MAG: hypothetical protein U0231_13685 [Nitrospiraceae bacterium]